MFQIITDIADIPQELQELWRDRVSVASTSVMLELGPNTEVYYDALERPEKFLEIDEKLRRFGGRGKITSSMPVVYGEAGDPPSVEMLTLDALRKGKDVLYLAANSTITGSYGAVTQLYEAFQSEFPDRTLIAVDSECTSTGLRMLIADLLDRNFKTIQEADGFILMDRPRIAHLFTWLDLSYIRMSGKVSGAAAAAARLFSLKPFGSYEYGDDGFRRLEILDNGVRTRSRTRLKKLFADFIYETIADESGVVTVSHGNEPDFAAELAGAIRERLPRAEVFYGPDWRVGLTIQAYGGPTSIHVNYHRKKAGNSSRDAKYLVQSLLS